MLRPSLTFEEARLAETGLQQSGKYVTATELLPNGAFKGYVAVDLKQWTGRGQGPDHQIAAVKVEDGTSDKYIAFVQRKPPSRRNHGNYRNHNELVAKESVWYRR